LRHHKAFDARMGHVVFGLPRTPLDEIVLQIRAGGQVWAVAKSFGSNSIECRDPSCEVLGRGRQDTNETIRAIATT
jgi:hypothetical protein